jgi:hypothetical protein
MCDAVLVLGGGVRTGGELPAQVVRRFDRAIELARGAPIVCLSAATVHRPPPLNEEGFPWFESAAGAAYLLAKGVPANRIQVEALSHDTIGNAYFSKLLHVDPPGWRRVLVITSEFHMQRSRAIFEWVYGLTPGRYQLQFEATPDQGFDPILVERRRVKEAAALRALEPIMARIRDLDSFHRWIYTEHQAYTAQGWVSRKASSGDIVEIY